MIRVTKYEANRPFHLEKAESVLLSMLFLQLSLRKVVLYFSLFIAIAPAAASPALSIGR